MWIRFETSPDLPPDGWKLCDGQVLSTHLEPYWASPSFTVFSLKFSAGNSATVRSGQPMLCNGNLVEHHHLVRYFPPQGDFQVIEEGTWQGLETPHINCDQVKQLVEWPFLTK